VPVDPNAGDSSAPTEEPNGDPSPEPVDTTESGHDAAAKAEAPIPAPPPVPPVIDVADLDWERIAGSVAPGAVRARMRGIVEALETLLDSESGLQLLFDDQREKRTDRALRVAEISDAPLWFIGDLHGDLLALEAALALIDRETRRGPRPCPARAAGRLV